MMREMASRDIFDHKPGSMEKGAISQNIADNLKNFEEIVVTRSSCLQIYLIFFCKTHKKITVKKSPTLSITLAQLL